MHPKQRDSAFTLLEVMVSLTAVSLLLLVTYGLLQTSVRSSQRISGDQLAAGQLDKVESRLKRDMFATAYPALEITDGPSSLVGKDGDAIWFLSAYDPVSESFIRNDDGTPRWQRNILYYLVLPSGLTVSASGSGIDVGGYEVSRPHKLLIRKVIDAGSPTLATDPTTQESLILASDIAPYLERPNGFSLTAPNAESFQIVGRDLLSFQAQKDDTQGRVTLTVQGANVEEAKKLFPIGSRSIQEAPYLVERQFEFYPENRDSLSH